MKKKDESLHNLFLNKIDNFLKTDVPRLKRDQTVSQAIANVRGCCPSERIVYFYVIDNEERLIGVVPTRRLLMAKDETLIKEIMVENVISVSENSTFIEVVETFHRYRFLAIPVVDKERKLKGVIDLSSVTETIYDFEDKKQADVVFESLGYELSQLKNASILKIFTLRVKWLSTTILSGFLCAGLTYLFVDTILKDKTLTFFIALILALGESVSTQSMTITLQALHNKRPTWKWFKSNLKKELKGVWIVALFLGVVVMALLFLFLRDFKGSFIIGFAIIFSVFTSSIIGLSLPTLLHKLNFNYKIAASPTVLATTDIFTLTIYFGVASLIF